MGKYDHINIDGTELTEQEQFVLEQAEKGEPADLKARFGEAQENRSLRARFLVELVIGRLTGVVVHRRGIWIENAVISDPLDLQDAEVSQTLGLMDFIFQGPVICLDTYFKKHLILKGSKFAGLVDCQRVRLDGSVFLDNAVFKGPVKFASANVGGQLNAKEAHFEGKGKENQVIFNGIQVGQGVFFQGAEFRGSVNFVNADVGGSFGFESVHCKGQGIDNLVSFNGMRVSQDAFFHNTFFFGPVDFGGANIGRQFSAREAQFIGEDEENQSSFNAMKVGQNAIFDYALFKWPVDLSHMYIGRQFSADGAQFHYPDSPALFHRLEVEQDAYFRSTSFRGGVTFTMMNISGSLYFDPLQERDNLKRTIVNGSVKFGGSSIGGQLKTDFACFGEKGEKSLASFNGLTVSQEAFFKGTIFKGTVHICFAHLLDLVFEGNPDIAELLLENTHIGRKLEISQTTIKMFQGKSLEVKGPATLRQVTISGEANFQDSSFQVLNLQDVAWPQNQEKVLLQGLTYQSINAGDGKEDWRRLLTWVKGSRFNTQNYSQLEAFFSRCGYRDRADEVFISGKREAANLLIWVKKWLTRIFWGGLAGYGRKPWQVLYVILPLVALGTFLFAPEFTAKSLESYGWLNQMKQNHPWIIQFLVSLDRFLPGVDLGLAKEWSPACVGLFTFAYWYFLKLAGWITIPIALAAIYTRIK